MADTVARHLVAAGQMLDSEPEIALAHAQAARRLAPRIAAVREALGLATYYNGEWQAAIAELRTYHRITGRQTHLAVLADCERALGRPERAVDIYRSTDRATLTAEEAVELLIVAAGARGDLGQRDAAVAMLQVRELTSTSKEPWVARLRYAYAEALLVAGRRDEAREWFARAAEIDEDFSTDAAERLLELDGVLLDDDEVDEFEDAEGEYTRDVPDEHAGDVRDERGGNVLGKPAEAQLDVDEADLDADDFSEDQDGRVLPQGEQSKSADHDVAGGAPDQSADAARTGEVDAARTGEVDAAPTGEVDAAPTGEVDAVEDTEDTDGLSVTDATTERPDRPQ